MALIINCWYQQIPASYLREMLFTLVPARTCLSMALPCSFCEWDFCLICLHHLNQFMRCCTLPIVSAVQQCAFWTVLFVSKGAGLVHNFAAPTLLSVQAWCWVHVWSSSAADDTAHRRKHHSHQTCVCLLCLCKHEVYLSLRSHHTSS